MVNNALEPVARDFSTEKVRDHLEALGESLNCDVDLEDAQDKSAADRLWLNATPTTYLYTRVGS
jgi:hypothetical protein